MCRMKRTPLKRKAMARTRGPKPGLAELLNSGKVIKANALGGKPGERTVAIKYADAMFSK